MSFIRIITSNLFALTIFRMKSVFVVIIVWDFVLVKMSSIGLIWSRIRFGVLFYVLIDEKVAYAINGAYCLSLHKYNMWYILSGGYMISGLKISASCMLFSDEIIIFDRPVVIKKTTSFICQKKSANAKTKLSVFKFT